MSIGHLAAGVALLSGLTGAGTTAFATQQLLDQMSARFNSISDYEITVDSSAREGSGLKQRRYRFDFKKPGMVRLRTLSGENKDGELCVRPDGRIRGRKDSGLVKMFAVTMSRSDDRLKDSEGIGVWEMDYGSTINRLRTKMHTPGNKVSVTGPTSGNYLLELHYGAGRLAGMTDRYWISSDSLWVTRCERWQNNAIVERSVYSNLRVNIGLSNGYFEF
jgi:outer membrane lipoprotein-sorting protein